MGYLKDIREKLEKKLESLDKQTRKEIEDFVAQTVLESYRNGEKSTRPSKKEKREKSAKK